MSIYKEQILPAIYNCRASPNFFEHIEGKIFCYIQNSYKQPAQIRTAFFSSFYKALILYVQAKDDERVAIYWTEESIYQKARNFGIIRNKLQSDRDINIDNIITDYQIT